MKTLPDKRKRRSLWPLGVPARHTRGGGSEGKDAGSEAPGEATRPLSGPVSPSNGCSHVPSAAELGDQCREDSTGLSLDAPLQRWTGDLDTEGVGEAAREPNIQIGVQASGS